MKNIKIGTRNSPLAMWQAEEVAKKLNVLGYATEILPIVSSGDKNLTQPLYEMGITGVFTKDLDIALLNQEIDIAVHSLKDVPTILPQNIELIACLERDFPQDVLVRSKAAQNKPLEDLKIATSSLRRRAFWSKEYPNTVYADIRGNVQTRLAKLESENFDATMFSLAGIKRMDMELVYEEIPHFVSAPAQGVVTIAGHTENKEINAIVQRINHQETSICTQIERSFLNTLEGGCTAPIGALAFIKGEKLHFVGRLCSLDGKKCLEEKQIVPLNETENLGEKMAQNILANGGKALMEEITSLLYN